MGVRPKISNNVCRHLGAHLSVSVCASVISKWVCACIHAQLHISSGRHRCARVLAAVHLYAVVVLCASDVIKMRALRVGRRTFRMHGLDGN